MAKGGDGLAVKPSAQPTMVRTHHLPPPAETARDLPRRRIRGPFAFSHPVSSAVIEGHVVTLVTDR
jgi:hypothetical protein